MSRIDKAVFKRSKTAVRRIGCMVAAMMLAVSVTSPVMAADSVADAPENNDLFFGVLEEEYVEEVVSYPVYRGDFSVMGALKGDVAYQHTSWIGNDILFGTVHFTQFLVTNGQTVKKGDPICQVNVDLDDMKTSELAYDIESKTETLAHYMETNEKILAKYKSIMNSGGDESQKQIAKFLYDRLSVQYEKERAERQTEIDNLKVEYNEYANFQTVQFIYAPSDGVISNLNRFRPMEEMGPYAYVATIYDTSRISIRITGGSDLLRYNMPVNICQNQGLETVVIPGRVTTCRSAAFSGNLSSDDDIIEIYGDPSKLVVNKDITIRFESAVMEDAVLVSKDAVYMDDKGDYVYVQIGSSSAKRYVTLGGKNSTVAWVISGVSEGDIVIKK